LWWLDYCLSDYVITDHGVKIVNQKDLEDAQSALKDTLELLKDMDNDNEQT
jgi:hypothetical protein